MIRHPSVSASIYAIKISRRSPVISGSLVSLVAIMHKAASQSELSAGFGTPRRYVDHDVVCGSVGGSIRAVNDVLHR
jgi:hypothetical protein